MTTAAMANGGENDESRQKNDKLEEEKLCDVSSNISEKCEKEKYLGLKGRKCICPPPAFSIIIKIIYVMKCLSSM